VARSGFLAVDSETIVAVPILRLRIWLLHTVLNRLNQLTDSKIQISQSHNDKPRIVFARVDHDFATHLADYKLKD